MTSSITTLDCRGMRCPAPILQIAKTARRVGRESYVLQVLADDDDFPKDVDAWCRASRATLHEIQHEGSVYRAIVGLNGAGKPEPATRPAGQPTRPQLQRRPPPPRSISAPPPPRAGPGPQGVPPQSISAPSQDISTPPQSISAPPQGASAPPQGASAPLRGISAPPQLPNFAAPRPPPPAAPVAPAPRKTPEPAPAIDTQPVTDSSIVQVDLRGHRAPAPIRHLSALLNTHPGHRVRLVSDDPSFLADLSGWCSALRVNIARTQKDDVTTVVELDLPGTPSSAASAIAVAPEPQAALQSEAPARENAAALCVLRNDFESLMAAMLVANGAAAQGMQVHIYFAFWGVNVLRGEHPREDTPSGGGVSWLQRLMKWMMPRGPYRQKMSKMHMGGLGKGVMQSFMRKNEVMSLPQLIDSCVEQNVVFIVCTMSMNMMGIEKRDIMDLPNIDWGSVSTFVDRSKRSSMSLIF